MSAGDSAAQEAQRLKAVAAEHTRRAKHAQEEATNYEIAAATEQGTARTLSPLAALDYRFLADRQWPGSARAQVDMVVVGDAGVYIVDTKAWREVRVQDGRIYRGDADATEDLDGLSHLMELTEDAVAEIGLVPGEVHGLVALAHKRNVDEYVGNVRVVGEKDLLEVILERGRRLTPYTVEAVHRRLMDLFPLVGQPAPVTAEIPEPVLPAPADQELEPDPDTDEIDVAELLRASLMRKPIEEWMTFLSPEQVKVVRRSFNGPARIRGAAGTGKTVVGLHRAAHLARTKGGPILVTTFVKTLPLVMSNLFAQMAPEVADRVQFTGVHGWATRFLRHRGIAAPIDMAQMDAAWKEAWHQVGRTGFLGKAARDPQYWRDEIQYVIKGRGLKMFDQYADLSRAGRQYPLTVDHRKAVWELYLAYEDFLKQRNAVDFNDVILMAELELKRHPLEEPYAAVIVDEAQDMTCAMVRLMYALAGDGEDAFTLIGDGQQSIYPGGYTLAEAGISVAGRGVVMDVNYRNTQQILTFARTMVEGSVVADIEGEVAPGDVSADALREGPKPHAVMCSDHKDRLARVVRRVQEVSTDVEIHLGDIAVLCLTNRHASEVIAALERADITTVDLTQYDGTVSEAVKVGTVKRAKGLEFKQVILADVSQDLLYSSLPPDDLEERERWEIDRREVYVAMTRARDGLWVGVV